MTGYKSKKAAALDEDGMYLVHHTKARLFDKFGNKVPDEDDDIQVYKKQWVDLTKEEKQECVNKSMYYTAWSSDVDLDTLIDAVGAMLKEKNNG